MTDPDTLNSEWQPIGRGTSLNCPLCTWFVDEPPIESRTVATGNEWSYQVRAHSALPIGLMHIVMTHPDSGQAREILERVAAHRDVPSVDITSEAS